MTRETLIQNILTNYGLYITEEALIPLVDNGKKDGLSYDLIYLVLKMGLCDLAGEEFYCTSSDMAKALGISNEEMNESIRKSKQELVAEGKNPDDYYREVPVHRFMM